MVVAFSNDRQGILICLSSLSLVMKLSPAVNFGLKKVMISTNKIRRLLIVMR